MHFRKVINDTVTAINNVLFNYLGYFFIFCLVYVCKCIYVYIYIRVYIYLGWFSLFTLI